MSSTPENPTPSSTHSPVDPLIGVLIDGRYRVTGRLARGGMATVYIAYDQRMEREVAVKVMHPHLADSADFLQRFQREARSAARITHPGVVSVFDQGIINGQGYLAMDLIHGLNLRQMLQANGALSLGRALHFTEQVLHALHAAHSVGVIHRDIKPENVLVDGSDRALLSDFGLARAATETSNSSTGSVLGTVAYVAPEVVTRGFIDARSDIYSTGIVLFELITGEVPWAGETPLQMAMHHASDSIPLPSSIQPWIPSEVDDVVAALTSLDPQFRPVDASQAASMVTQCISRLPHNLLDQRSPIAGVGLSKDVPNSEAQDAEGEDTPAPGNATTVMETVTPTSTLPTTASAAFTHTTSSLSSSAGVSAVTQAGTDLVTTSHKVPTDAQETNTPTRPAHAKKDVDPKRRKRLRKILIGFLFSLLLLGGGGYGGYVWWNELGPGSYYPVPAVAGQSEDEAQSALNALGVTIEREESFHDDIPAGSIISTSPDGGQQVHKTGKVTLLVSKGVDMRGVPDVRGKTAEEASTALVEAGLALGSATEEWSESVEKGRIIDQSTPAGELLKHDSMVNITVSKGREPMSVPNISGLSRGVAEEAARAVNLSITWEEAHSETVPEGTVISQVQAAGSTLYRGDIITATISLGPPLVEVPQVFGKQVDEAQRILQNAGFQVRVTKIFGGVFGTVRATDPDAGTKARKGSTITISVV